MKFSRLYTQISSTIFFNFPFLSTWLKHIPVPVLNCYACPLAAGACPIGSLQYMIISGSIPWLTVGLLVFFGLLAGRFFCGYLCPFGWVQDLLAKVPIKKRKLPPWFGYLKYFSLFIFTLALSFIFLTPIFCKICPAGALEGSLPIVGIEIYKKVTNSLPFGFSPILEMIGVWFALKMLLFAFFIGASLFFKRPFCKICPLGAVFSFFNKLRITPAPKLVLSSCTLCQKCTTPCPAGLHPPTQINSHNCIQCGQCTTLSCPASSLKNPKILV